MTMKTKTHPARLQELFTLFTFCIFFISQNVSYSAVILISDAEKAKQSETPWLDQKKACVQADPNDRTVELPICDHIDPKSAIGWQMAGGTIAAYMTPHQKSFEQGTKSRQSSAQNNAPYWLVVADENQSAVPHEVAQNLCASLSAEVSGNWRLPTVDEFKAMYIYNTFNKETFEFLKKEWDLEDDNITAAERMNWALGLPRFGLPDREHGFHLAKEPELPDFSGLDELDQIAAELEAEDEAESKPKEEKIEAPDYIDPHFLTKNAREVAHKNFKRRTYWTLSERVLFVNHPAQNLLQITNPTFVEGIQNRHRTAKGPIIQSTLSHCDYINDPSTPLPENTSLYFNITQCLLKDTFLQTAPDPYHLKEESHGDNSICVQQWRQPKRKQTLHFEVDDVRKCFASNPTQFDRVGRICPEVPAEKAIGWRLNGGVIIGQEEIDKDGDGQKEKYWLLIDQIDHINEANYQYSLQTLESAQNACKNLQYGSLMGEEPLKGWFLPSVEQMERAFCLAKTDGGVGKEHTPEFPSSRRYQNCANLNAEVIPNFLPDQYWAAPYTSPDGTGNEKNYTINFLNGADRQVKDTDLTEARHRVRCMVHVPVELAELPVE